MALELPENIYQTSSGGGVGALTLLAAPSGRQNLADWVSNGATIICTIKDTNDTETSRCTFNTGPDRITRDTLIRSTTGAFINFAGGGILDITVGMPGLWVEKMYDPATNLGLVARLDANGNVQGRDILDGTWVQMTNGDGISGDPQIVDADIGTNFVRKTGSVGEDITGIKEFQAAIRLVNNVGLFSEILAGAAFRKLAFLSAADVVNYGDVLEPVAISSSSATGLAHNGNTIWDANNDGASSGLDADLIQGYDWAAAANFTSATDGFIKFPNGIILNWGTGSVTEDSSDTQTLAKAYSTTHFAAVGCIDDSGTHQGNEDGIRCGPGASPLSQVIIRVDPSVGSGDIFGAWNYFSIGV